MMKDVGWHMEEDGDGLGRDTVPMTSGEEDEGWMEEGQESIHGHHDTTWRDVFCA